MWSNPTSSESDGMADRVKSGRTVEHASDMLIALTTPSATLPVTAAIAAQPVQITTALRVRVSVVRLARKRKRQRVDFQ